MKKVKLITLVALIPILFAACRKEAMNPATTSGETGSFKVRMTDSPANYAGLFVEITRVDAWVESKGWVTLSNEAQLISVLDLTNGAETTLAFDSRAAAGAYSRLRLTFGEEHSLIVDGSAGPVTFAVNCSGESAHEVIIEIDEQVNAGSSTEVLLDFDVAESVIESGTTYVIEPAITEVEDETTGISGDVQGTSQASVTLSNSGEQYNTFVSASGEFLIRGVADGTYSLHIEGMKEGAILPSEVTLNNVVIVQGEIKNMGEIQL